MTRAWTTLAALGGATLVVVAGGVLASTLPLRLYLLGALAVMSIPAAISAASPRARRPREALLAGAALAGLFAPATWVVMHPLVHVDNATGETIELWIDGARGPLLPPGVEGIEPPRVRVALGMHRFGWSRPNEGAPREETRAEVGAFDEHLYNPAGAGCYWLEAAAYGDAETRGMPRGPQRIAAFYRFDRVDAWFAPLPRSALVAWVLSGTSRLAVRRHRACMALAELGCERSLRAAFVTCERTLNGPGAAPDCATIARAACSTRASAAATAAAGTKRERGGDEKQPK